MMECVEHPEGSHRSRREPDLTDHGTAASGLTDKILWKRDPVKQRASDCELQLFSALPHGFLYLFPNI